MRLRFFHLLGTRESSLWGCCCAPVSDCLRMTSVWLLPRGLAVLAHHGACYALRLTELLDSVPAALEANAVSVLNVVVVDNTQPPWGRNVGVG